MAYTHPLNQHPDAAVLRKQAGKYVKGLREAAGLTQMEVTKKIGVDYYTLVSQVERGLARIPPDKIADWADAVGVDRKMFAQRLLEHYDPFMWQMLFGPERKSRKS